MAVTGHLTRSVFQRYEIVNSGDVRDGLARMVQAQDAAKGAVKAHPSPGMNKTPRNSEGLAMEARGIEPRSEPRSEAALRA